MNTLGADINCAWGTNRKEIEPDQLLADAKQHFQAVKSGLEGGGGREKTKYRKQKTNRCHEREAEQTVME